MTQGRLAVEVLDSDPAGGDPEARRVGVAGQVYTVLADNFALVLGQDSELAGEFGQVQAVATQGGPARASTACRRPSP